MAYSAIPLALLLFIYRRYSTSLLDPVALFCYLFVLTYLFRDIVIALGFDSPYPDYLFVGSDVVALLKRTSLDLSLFLVAFIGGTEIASRLSTLKSSWFAVLEEAPRRSRLVSLVRWLTTASTVITIALAAKFGGPVGMIRALKVNKDFAGLPLLRAVPAIGAVVSTVLLIDAIGSRGTRGGRKLITTAFAATIANATFVFLWGSRSVAILCLLTFFGGLFVAAPRAARSGRNRRHKALVLLVICLVVSIVGLRLVRDTLLTGEVLRPLAGETPVRKVSVALDSVQFDAFLLAERDWPSQYPYRGPEDLVNGVGAIVPRLLWPTKPLVVSVGSWFRQVYQPGIINGWPVGAAGEWYLAFGRLGIALAGGLAGAIYLSLTRAAARLPFHSWNFAMLTILALVVFPLGITAQTPIRIATWIVPLALASRYLEHRRAGQAGYASLRPLPIDSR